MTEEDRNRVEAYAKTYLHTLYLQHLWKMSEPVDVEVLTERVRLGIEEDIGVAPDTEEVRRLIEQYVPEEHRNLSPAEAEAVWDSIALHRKEVNHG
jgi:hypothetical protein